jgi:hypothetical protein
MVEFGELSQIMQMTEYSLPTPIKYQLNHGLLGY